MDVVAMFPNLQHKGVARTCREEFLKSGVTIEYVDTVALGIYLAILYQDRRAELKALGLDQVVQKSLHPKAKKILIPTEEVLEPDEKVTSKLNPPGSRSPLGAVEADAGTGPGAGHSGYLPEPILFF